MIPGQAQQFFEGAAAQAAGGDFEIERSLRFNSGDSAYLNRTPSSAGNRKKWTLSCWYKRTSFSDSNILSAGSDVNNRTLIGFGMGNNDDKIYITQIVAGGGYNSHKSLAVFRDSSAWYHIVVAADTSQSTAANRFKLYVNRRS